MKYNSNMSKVKILKDLVSSIGKIKASTPVKAATDKKWTQLSITDETGKVIGVARQIVGKTTEIRPKTPEFKKHLIDVGGVPDEVTAVFHFDTNSQKAINKLLNKPSLKKNLGGYVETPVKGRRRDI
jgi:hypothetical protein